MNTGLSINQWIYCSSCEGGHSYFMMSKKYTCIVFPISRSALNFFFLTNKVNFVNFHKLWRAGCGGIIIFI